MRSVNSFSVKHGFLSGSLRSSGRVLALGCLLSLPFLVAAPPADAASDVLPGNNQAPAAGVLAAVEGTVWIDREGRDMPLTATIGMRLQPGDQVRTEADSSASVWVPGGIIFRVPPGNRVEISRDVAQMDGPEQPIQVGSLAILEEGIWVLSEPGGSLILGAMRGGSSDPAFDDGSPWLLSPRQEVITEDRPSFIWSGAASPVRVVLSLNKDIVWRSKSSSDSSLYYPTSAPALAPSDQYQWWLEDVGSGEALTEAAPFRRGDESIMENIAAFEKEMAVITDGPNGAMVKAFMQCAFYERIQAWSRVLQASAELQALQDGYSEPAEKAATWARLGMGLAPGQVDKLLQVLQSAESD